MSISSTSVTQKSPIERNQLSIRMQFTLIHYTEGWRIGATVTLSGTPAAGTLVKASLDTPDDYTDIYYIDNVLWGDGGENYLFVRPFEGYGEMAPMTEIDRLNEKLKEISEAIDNLNDNVMSYLPSITLLSRLQ